MRIVVRCNIVPSYSSFLCVKSIFLFSSLYIKVFFFSSIFDVLVFVLSEAG